MKPTRTLTMTLCFVTLASAGLAQPAVELTPFAGFSFGGSFEDRFENDSRFSEIDVEEGENLGAFVDITVATNAQIELLYSVQETQVDPGPGPDLDVDIEYFQIGGLYQWTPGHTMPYVAGSFGATRFDVAGEESETRFSGTIGGGVKVMPTNHIGIRFDGRLYTTFIEEDEDSFCDPDFCFGYEDSTFFHQVQFHLGVIIGF